MLHLLASHRSFLNSINIYTRPTCVLSLVTIKLKLRLLARIVIFTLEESPAASIDFTWLIYELNMYLDQTYICTNFDNNLIKITVSIVYQSFLFGGKYFHYYWCHIGNLWKKNFYLCRSYKRIKFGDNRIKITIYSVSKLFCEGMSYPSYWCHIAHFAFHFYYEVDEKYKLTFGNHFNRFCDWKYSVYVCVCLISTKFGIQVDLVQKSAN